METSQVEIMRREVNLPKAAQNRANESQPLGESVDRAVAAISAGKLWISETFTSRQGEGRLTGTNSFFIRTSGCNLRCWFCDTPYASWQPEGDWMTIDSLVDAAKASQCDHVVLTGGEPLLPLGMIELVRRLRSAAMHVTIETAGTVFRDATCDLVSISPKLAGSGPRGQWQKEHQRHESARWRPEVIRQLIANSLDHQLKFVVEDQNDFADAVAAADEIAVIPENVWIMPQGTSEAELDSKASWLTALCDDHGYRYCERMHIRWYGNRRGT
jgi:7-carboxy-7-deazaguanine synthase